jgi:hypothetical protein
MGQKQGDLGRNTEKNITDFFQQHRYWALIIPRGVGGQPFDIIARYKNKKIGLDDMWFIDAKHLEENKVSFSFNRIEANQISSMEYARDFCGIDEQMGFVVEWEKDGNLYYFSFEDFLRISEEGRKSIKIEEMQNFSELIRENLNVHKNIK